MVLFNMFIKTFPVGMFQCNCTILGDTKTGEAIVIDPGDEADRIVKELKQNNLKVKYILHTHTHIDHIGATAKLKDQTQGKIAIHKDDLFLYENIAMQAQVLGLPLSTEVKPIDHYLNHGDIIDWGKNQRIEIIHTPGHTPGSVSFVIKECHNQNKDLLFSGDTLFMGSIGRTDLWGGDYNQIIYSIKSQLLTLDDELVVITGHGPNTTIGQEKKINPFL